MWKSRFLRLICFQVIVVILSAFISVFFGKEISAESMSILAFAGAWAAGDEEAD